MGLSEDHGGPPEVFRGISLVTSRLGLYDALGSSPLRAQHYNLRPYTGWMDNKADPPTTENPRLHTPNLKPQTVSRKA